jgi:molecular chaperone GrpE (heat shock protein)
MELDEWTSTLQMLMQQANLSSFTALSRKAGVSTWQVRQLRQGRLAQMRLAPLQRLAQALEVSFPDLLTQFEQSHNPAPSPTLESTVLVQQAALQQECDRLTAQLSQQRQQLQQEFQQASLHILESWLKQWPSAVQAAQNNPQLPALKILPLLRPLDQLLQQWGVEAIAPLGAIVAYDPRWHQLQSGHGDPGASVQICRVGYRWGEKLLYRAEVSPREEP